MQTTSVMSSSMDRSESFKRPTEASIAAFENLQFTSATDCLLSYLKDGGIGSSFKEDSQKTVSNKLLKFLGETMHQATECLMMQRKDNFNSEFDYTSAHDPMAIFKKSLSSYKLVALRESPGQQAPTPPSINDLDQFLIDLTIYKNY